MNFLQHFTNLLIMAAADGALTEREIKFLMNRSARWGITEEEFSKAVAYALSDKAELRVPTQEPERHSMLRDLIRMMAADGELADVEKQLFAAVAAKMKMSDNELNALIDSVLGE
ncbi:MAG: TerB family tellurite resistance protein [Pirellulaceae bacterium]